MTKKKKILILGGGIAALSTGIHLLEDGGAARFDVTVVCMEHRLGGKAASWRLPDGRLMETGFHAIFGYYKAIQGLLARCGRSVRDPAWFRSNEGRHLMYEAGARAVNRLEVPSGPTDLTAIFGNGLWSYQGMNAVEKVKAARWFAEMLPRLVLEKLGPELDEHSFTAWAISTGLDRELTRKSWFRYVLDLAFNYPHEGSAYVGARGFRALLGYENSEVFYLNGGLSEVIIAPLAARLAALGGKVEFCEKATALTLDPRTRRVTEVVTTPMARPRPIAGVFDHVDWEPLGGGYSLEENPYPKGDPAPASGATPRTRRLGIDFDEIVSTLPIESTKALLRTTPRFEEAVLAEPQLARIWHLRTVASTSLRVWFPKKVMPSDFDTVVMGTPQPAATIIDYTNVLDELRRGPYGSVVEWEGQEGLFGDFTDEEIVRMTLDRFVELPFVDRRNVSIDDVMAQRNGHRWQFRRNTAHHMRYILMEPGHWKYRPEPARSPYENLTFAGDWMNSSQPTASMEAAVRTGRVAAAILRERVGLGPPP